MRVAAIYDIHGNLPALDAVLEEIRAAATDLIVVGGDVLPGPMPVETLARLSSLEIPTQFIQGNGEVAVLAEMHFLEGYLQSIRREKEVSSLPRKVEKLCDIAGNALAGLHEVAFDLERGLGQWRRKHGSR